MATLVIGYGNTLRGDDGVGYRVAEAVESWGLEAVKAHPCHQLTPELAADMAEVDRVVFLDATPPQNPCSPVVVERIHPQPVGVSVSTHQNNPQTLLGLCRDLYGHVPDAYVILMPTRDFDFSEQLSPMAAIGVEQVTDYLRHQLLPSSSAKNPKN